MKTAFIFPAFVSDYLGNEIQILESFSDVFLYYLDKLSVVSGEDFQNFSLDNPLFTEDELRSQLISYLFSCSLSDILSNKKIIPDYLAGYSMGLYAAMYTGKVIDFEGGIKLIKNAYLFSKSVIGDINSGMGSVIGLTKVELEQLILKDQLEAEIANTNNLHSHLVTGSIESVNKLLNKARKLGALNVSLLNVSTPYHSQLLKNTKEQFKQFIDQEIILNNSLYPIISAIDHRSITQQEDITKELIQNLYLRINWMGTFNKLLSLDVDRFIECGAGKSLHKIGRFCPGNFKVYPINKVSTLFS